MAWLTLSEALDALRQRFEEVEGFSPAQRVLIVEVIDRWRHTLQTQERAPGERRKCSVCGNMVPPVYVLDSTKRPTHIMCPGCWLKDSPRDDWPEAVTLTSEQWEDFKEKLFPLIFFQQPEREPTLKDLHALFPEEEK